MEPIYVNCNNGFFTLPDALFETLTESSTSGVVYVRQDEDVATISPCRIADARRRALSQRCRFDMFRNATKLAVIELPETIRVMAVEWRAPHSPSPPPV